MPCHGWGITFTMHAVQGEAVERARAAALQSQLQQKGQELAALSAQLESAREQAASAERKVRAPAVPGSRGV